MEHKTHSNDILLLCLAEACHGGVLFSSLQPTLASPQPGQALNAGEDSITVSWGLNQNLVFGTDELYKNVKVKLCYAPESQKDHRSFEWIIEKDVPTETYFERAYAYDSAGKEVGYGQTTDVKKSSDLFEIQGITERHLPLDVASVCFSAFSVVSLFGFFLLEKMKSSVQN
ncbi:hypothetical protein Acr_06g0001530 [Actinidia rufa]|uniref:Uncharacterized protein n=1 Tax=Actinidia rufa TaxID=165716 RepID=A0A7J0ENY5_9ERIC|nr:hypothetical protein Acr_06g0001530 [Actinidia rufa]